MADEKRIMRGLSRRRQQEDMSHARLDILFLLLFPLFFLVFNLVYWLSFLYGSCSNCDADDYTAGPPPPPQQQQQLEQQQREVPAVVDSSTEQISLLEEGFIV